MDGSVGPLWCCWRPGAGAGTAARCADAGGCRRDGAGRLARPVLVRNELRRTGPGRRPLDIGLCGAAGPALADVYGYPERTRVLARGLPGLVAVAGAGGW